MPAEGTSKMADDPTKRAPQDASKINVHEAYEVRYWTSKFGVSETKLKAAVAAAGTSAKKVEDYLKKH
jgi:hypothetical protein